MHSFLFIGNRVSYLSGTCFPEQCIIQLKQKEPWLEQLIIENRFIQQKQRTLPLLSQRHKIDHAIWQRTPFPPFVRRACAFPVLTSITSAEKHEFRIKFSISLWFPWKIWNPIIPGAQNGVVAECPEAWNWFHRVHSECVSGNRVFHVKNWKHRNVSRFFKYENVLEVFSTIFGSTFLYVYVIPCLAALNAKLYHKTLCCCLISDFLNLILKWWDSLRNRCGCRLVAGVNLASAVLLGF